MTECTPFDWCFQQGGPPHGKAAHHNGPWLSEVRSSQHIAAQGFWTANADTPQWPCKLPRFENGIRACRCPGAPCLLVSTNNSRLSGPRTFTSASLIHRTPSQPSSQKVGCHYFPQWGCQFPATSPLCYHCTGCCWR